MTVSALEGALLELFSVAPLSTEDTPKALEARVGLPQRRRSGSALPPVDSCQLDEKQRCADASANTTAG